MLNYFCYWHEIALLFIELDFSLQFRTPEKSRFIYEREISFLIMKNEIFNWFNTGFESSRLDFDYEL